MPGSTKVVDSWAMVAWIRDEPAAAAFDRFLQEADSGTVELCMSWMNVAETFYILSKRVRPALAEEFLAPLDSWPIRTVLNGKEGILSAARIKARQVRPSS